MLGVIDRNHLEILYRAPRMSAPGLPGPVREHVCPLQILREFRGKSATRRCRFAERRRKVAARGILVATQLQRDEVTESTAPPEYFFVHPSEIWKILATHPDAPHPRSAHPATSFATAAALCSGARCAYRSVILMSEWPSSSRTVFRSTPA